MASSTLSFLLVTLAAAKWTPPEERHVPNLHAVTLIGRDGEERNEPHSLGDLVAEEWSAVPSESSNDGRGVVIRGLNRAFLVRPADAFTAALRSWREVSFRKLHLLNKRLSFTIDLSSVGCGCNAAVYLVGMGEVSDSLIDSGYW